MEYYEPQIVDFKETKENNEKNLELTNSSEIRKTLVEMRTGSHEK